MQAGTIRLRNTTKSKTRATTTRFPACRSGYERIGTLSGDHRDRPTLIKFDDLPVEITLYRPIEKSVSVIARRLRNGVRSIRGTVNSGMKRSYDSVAMYGHGYPFRGVTPAAVIYDPGSTLKPRIPLSVDPTELYTAKNRVSLIVHHRDFSGHNHRSRPYNRCRSGRSTGFAPIPRYARCERY